MDIQEVIRAIVGDEVEFSHDSIVRAGKTRHTVKLKKTIDPLTERPIVASGETPEDAARKALEKIPPS